MLLAASGAPFAAAGCRPHGTGRSSDLDTLTVATADNISSLDPALAYDTWSTSAVHALTRRLVDYDEQAKLVPELAERWQVSGDGKLYTFHLRPGQKFADGTTIEAKHFKAALEWVLEPKTASPGSGFYSGIEGLLAPESGVLQVRLKEADPTMINALGMTFAAPIQEGKEPAASAFSGPYAVERADLGSEVRLRRNPRCPVGGGWAERLAIQLRVEESLQMTRFENGEVDLLPSIPPAQLARVAGDPRQRDQLAQGVVSQTWYFGVNVTRPPWSDPRVRRAALLAIDREFHVRIAGAGQAANGILPPHVPGYDPSRRLPPRDLDAARRLLAEAGFPNGLPPERPSVMWLANSDQHVRHGEAIQSDLRQAGIAVELRPATLSQYLTAYKTNADCWFGGWYPDFPDAGNFLEPVFHGKSIKPGASLNAARYNNPQVNALLDRAHGTPLGAEREALYHRAEEQLLQDLPWLPLYYEAEVRYFQKWIGGVAVDPVWRQRLTGIRKSRA